MVDIFFSYARADRDRVAPIVSLLEAHGWSVWWDAYIDAGEQWDEVIEREVEAARCMIVVWSCHSVGSRWVRTEAAEVLDRGILVPVLIDAAKLPLEFRRVQAIDLTGWRGDAQEGRARMLVAAVTRLLGQPIANGGSASGTPHVHRQKPSLLRRTRRHAIEGLRASRRFAARLAGRCLAAVEARIEQLTLGARRFRGMPVLSALAGALIVVVPFLLWLLLTGWGEGQQPSPRPQLTKGEMRLADRLLEQGERFLEQGRVAYARSSFQFVADLGVAEGAFRLAETYDPVGFPGPGVIGPLAEPDHARDWYKRADDLGHPEAGARLKRLDALLPP